MNTSNTCRQWINMSTGAYRAESTASSRTLAPTPMTPPPAAADAPRQQGADQAQHLRNQQHHHAEPEQGHHEPDIESRPGGEELKIVIEVLGADQVRLYGEREADAEHHQPERRGQIAHNADPEVHPAGEAQAGRPDDFQVLQISLGPAAVANRDVDERRRRLFPGSAAVGGHAHLPAAAAHQRGLDEVMRQHEAAEGLAAAEFGQPAVLGEGLHANDGVVPPIIAAVSRPRGPGRA